MGVRAWWVLLLLATGCATTRVVHLDTGAGAPIVYTPVERTPVEIGEAEFKRAVTRLMLDMKLDVADGRRSLLASSVGLVDGARGRTVAPAYERLCARTSGTDSCLSLLGPMERRMLALSFALDTVWEGVEEALQELADPTALRVMVTSVIGTALVMLVAPEPVTKVIAVALTASLIAYLGLGPVWNLGQGFLRLLDESRDARRFAGLEEAGHRFGKVLGGNGARVLVIVALTALGGRNAMAAQGPRLPGAAQAAVRAEAEGGFQLSAALSGEVRSIAMPAAGVLNVTLAPTAVAAVAMGTGGGIQGDPDGEIHHICTDKNEVSEASGGPWTPLFQEVFERAGMSLNDAANKVRIRGHQGPHPRQYHEEVLRRIDQATLGCRGASQCRAALVDELSKIAHELVTEGTRLRKLITKSP
jgi:hypothetical protein